MQNGNPGVSKSGSGRQIAKIYQKKSLLEHILLRPDNYIGTMEHTKELMLVFNKEENKMVKKELTFVPGLYKIYDAILVNAFDNNNSISCIKIDIDPEKNVISIWNNGKGIPVVIHKKEKMYVPTMIFGHFFTSSHFNDEEKRVTGGRNGLGTKLCNIFSTSFTVETASSEYGKSFRQSWWFNMSKSTEPEIKDFCGNDFTKVTFSPDLAKFKMDCLDDDIVALMSRRAYDVASSTRGVAVYLNGSKIPVLTLRIPDNSGVTGASSDKSGQQFALHKTAPVVQAAAQQATATFPKLIGSRQVTILTLMPRKIKQVEGSGGGVRRTQITGISPTSVQSQTSIARPVNPKTYVHRARATATSIQTQRLSTPTTIATKVQPSLTITQQQQQHRTPNSGTTRGTTTVIPSSGTLSAVGGDTVYFYESIPTSVPSSAGAYSLTTTTVMSGGVTKSQIITLTNLETGIVTSIPCTPSQDHMLIPPVQTTSIKLPVTAIAAASPPRPIGVASIGTVNAAVSANSSPGVDQQMTEEINSMQPMNVRVTNESHFNPLNEMYYHQQQVCIESLEASPKKRPNLRDIGSN